MNTPSFARNQMLVERYAKRPGMTRRVLLVVTLLAACSISDEQEAQLGDDYARQINEQVPILRDAEVTEYVAALGEHLARGASDRQIDWHFSVVDAEPVNAFAVPGGHVYVNRGLIERAETLSELAGVIGHEIGHVTRRHSVEQLEKSQKTNIGVAVVCALTSVCNSDLARVAINVGGAALFARHSREDELEADAEGVRNVMRAGIDPRGIPSFFEKLLRERERRPAAVEAWFGSHPLEEQRIEGAKQLIGSLEPSTLQGLQTDDPAFQRMRDRLRSLPPSPPIPTEQPVRD